MSIYNADARLSQAVDTLATSPKDLKERLVIAWTQALVRIELEDLPTDLRLRFEALVALYTGRGTVQETLRDLNDGEIDNIMRRISGLARDVAQEADRQRYRGQ